LFLHRELVSILNLPEVKERLAALSFEPVGGTPEEFARHARAEFDKWARVIKNSNAMTLRSR
jgi:tripartite-type tricarboxylate transporter receptor subunit TctC